MEWGKKLTPKELTHKNKTNNPKNNQIEYFFKLKTFRQEIIHFSQKVKYELHVIKQLCPDPCRREFKEDTHTDIVHEGSWWSEL